MRIRQVKPAFWSDARLSELPETTRLFYIGLWMIADDAGWLRWEPTEVGRDLYGYDDRKKRERRVSQMFAELVAAGRVLEHPCGHAEIPKMMDHQHLAGATKQVRTSFNEHLRKCVESTGKSESPPSPANVRGGLGNGNGQVRLGSVRSGNDRASANPKKNGEPSLKEIVGAFADIVKPTGPKS